MADTRKTVGDLDERLTSAFDGTEFAEVFPTSGGVSKRTKAGTVIDKDVGTSGATVPLLNGDNDFSGDNTFSGITNLALSDFSKTASDAVAWKKTAAFAVSTNMALDIEIGGKLYSIAESTALTMPASPVIGQDYAIWIQPNGVLRASENFTVTGDVPANSRQLGGFHYAPGGTATLDPSGNWANHSGGNKTPQINEYSFWDLKWRPSVADPRGLTLVPGLREWWGIYPMSNGNEGGPLHMYGVQPCRDGNAPFKMWATTPAAYTNATPMNIFELLAYYGFRPPSVYNFQFAALGTTEQTAAGGSAPGNTGDVNDRDKNRFTSAWGLFDITGVINAWGADALLTTTDTAGVTQGRSNDIFRVSRFAFFGGSWGSEAAAGSRYVNATTSSNSDTNIGGRGCCSHLVIP